MTWIRGGTEHRVGEDLKPHGLGPLSARSQKKVPKLV